MGKPYIELAAEDNDFDMNMPLRSLVLEWALQVEKIVTELIILYLDVSTENLKAFGHESSNIPFSDKLNILLDTGIFRDSNGKALSIYNECVCISQIRNKIVHVYECNSFVTLMKMVKKTPVSLKGYLPDEKATGDDELDYKLAYMNLCKHSLITVNHMKYDKELKIASKKAMVEAISQLYKIELDTSLEFQQLLLGFISLDCKEHPDKVEEYQQVVKNELKKIKDKVAKRRSKYNQNLKIMGDIGFTTDILTETL